MYLIISQIPAIKSPAKASSPAYALISNKIPKIKIANIKLDGTDVCPIPAYEIREYPDPTYTIEMPNGSVMKHRSKQEALQVVRNTLELIKTPEGSDAFFGRNGF